MFLLPANIKTQDEIWDLMYQWRRDPCYDVYEAADFQDYRSLLSILQHEQMTEWQQRNERMYRAKAVELNCSVALAEYIMRLESRIVDLEAECNEREYNERMAFNVKLYAR